MLKLLFYIQFTSGKSYNNIRTQNIIIVHARVIKIQKYREKFFNQSQIFRIYII